MANRWKYSGDINLEYGGLFWREDGALWLIPEGMEWDEETDFFKWPDEETDD